MSEMKSKLLSEEDTEDRDVEDQYLKKKLERCLNKIKVRSEAVFPHEYLKDEGCEKLCEYLMDNEEISSLDLRGNDIHRRGAKAIANLINVNTKIHSLHLEWNTFGDGEGLEYFCDAIASNPVISFIDLKNNQIGPDGGILLGRMIMRNSTLSHIDLRWNNLLSNGGEAILDGLKHNKTLKICLLGGNNIRREILNQIDHLLEQNKNVQQQINVNSSMNYTLNTIRTDIINSDNNEGNDRLNKTVQYEDASRLRLLVNSHSPHSVGSRSPINKNISLSPTSFQNVISPNEHPGNKIFKFPEQPEGDLENKLKAEVATFDHYRNNIEEELQNLKEDKARLISEMLEKSKNLEEFERKFDDIKSENEELKHKLDMLTGEKKRLKDREQKQTISHQDEVRALKDEIERLNLDLEKSSTEYQTQIKTLEGRLQHEINMRESERNVYSKAAEESDKLHEEEKKQIHEKYESFSKNYEENTRNYQNEIASKESEVSRLKKELVNVKLNHEEKFAAFETKMKEEQEVKIKETLEMLDERMKQLQEARDKLESRYEQERNEYKKMSLQNEKERQEFEEWLTKERTERQKCSRENQELALQISQLKNESKYKDHLNTRLESEIEEMRRQQGILYKDHQDAMDKVLADHFLKAKGLEDSLRQRDNELVELNSQIRSKNLIISQFEEEEKRRTHLFRNTLSSLQETLEDLSKPKRALPISPNK